VLLALRKERVMGLPSWRAQIGFISPPPVVDIGWYMNNFGAIFPKDVNGIAIGFGLNAVTPEECKEGAKRSLALAIPLQQKGVDVVCFACTAGAFILGVEHDRKLIEDMKNATGIPATSMATSVAEALNFLATKKIILVAPYIEEIIKPELVYFEGLGFDIVYYEGLGIESIPEIMGRTPMENYQFALKVWETARAKGLEADCIFITCGAMQVNEIIATLESETGIPVVSSNTCTAWNVLRLAGIHEPIHGYGKLLELER
jgi:maleate cis-trans isomerase